MQPLLLIISKISKALLISPALAKPCIMGKNVRVVGLCLSFCICLTIQMARSMLPIPQKAVIMLLYSTTSGFKPSLVKSSKTENALAQSFNFKNPLINIEYVFMLCFMPDIFIILLICNALETFPIWKRRQNRVVSTGQNYWWHIHLFVLEYEFKPNSTLKASS